MTPLYFVLINRLRFVHVVYMLVEQDNTVNALVFDLDEVGVIDVVAASVLSTLLQNVVENV